MQTAAISFRSYSMDLWGFGDTTHDANRYSLDKQVDLLDRFLLEMGIGKVALIGHGLGALVSILFARKYPAVVDRMMLVDVPLGSFHVAQRLRSPASPADLAEWLLGKYPVTEPARMDAPKADPLAITTSIAGMETSNFMAIMDSMVTPSLLVHGLNDPAVTSPEYERIMDMPDRIHQIIFDESGHFPMLDESPKFNRLMTDFLALFSGDSPRELQLKEEWKRRMR